LVLFASAGCAPEYSWDRRYGPSPILQAPTVEASVNNQIRILNALAADANISPGAPYYYYNIAEAGFNFVDDECTAYFNTLFFLDRQRERDKSVLLSAAQTTNAILSVTGAATKTLAVVAQAFGLGVNLTDIVANTYLYQLPPAVTLGFVKELRLAYRNGAAVRRAEINSPVKAYTQIQEYLSLCLPPTIESKLVEVIKAARAFPDPVTGANRTTFGLNIGSMPVASRPQLEEAINRTVLPSSTTQIPEGIKQTGLQPSVIAAYQQAICIQSPDGKVGAQTLRAVQDYLSGRERRRHPAVARIGPREESLLQEAVNQVGACRSKGFRNAYEVGAFGILVGGVQPAARIAEIQQSLQRHLQGQKLFVNSTEVVLSDDGRMTPATRAAIRKFREIKKLGPEKGDEIDHDLLLNLL
jgi:peptidoglycan hydrolase-like protein with peptidoglycan-binding domain